MNKNSLKRIVQNQIEVKLDGSSNVLLLGNGINRDIYKLTEEEKKRPNVYKSLSWDELVSEVENDIFKSCPCLKNLPFPLYSLLLRGYELLKNKKEKNYGILPKDINCQFKYPKNSNLFQRMILEYPNKQKKEFLSKLFSIGFDSILTTNYTFEVEKVLLNECNEKEDSRVEESNAEEVVNSIRENLTLCAENLDKEAKDRLFKHTFKQLSILKLHFAINKEQKVNRIWHIHGNLTDPCSLIFDHHSYGNSLSVFHEYMRSFMKNFNLAITHSAEKYIIGSWIDYFFLSNIYIVGLSLDPSEIDLWWLLHEISRLKDELKEKYKNIILGKITFYDVERNLDKELQKKALSSAFGIHYKNFYRKDVDEEKCIQKITECFDQKTYSDDEYYSNYLKVYKDIYNQISIECNW